MKDRAAEAEHSHAAFTFLRAVHLYCNEFVWSQLGPPAPCLFNCPQLKVNKGGQWVSGLEPCHVAGLKRGNWGTAPRQTRSAAAAVLETGPREAVGGLGAHGPTCAALGRSKIRLLPTPRSASPIGQLTIGLQHGRRRGGSVTHSSLNPRPRAARCLPPSTPAPHPARLQALPLPHAMACLAFGRAALLTHPSFSDRQLEELGRQLSVAEDLGRAAQECAVFDSLAQQVTAFITNLDEATVNCGAAEPSTFQISSSSGSSGSGGDGKGGGRAASSSSSSSSGGSKAGAAAAAATGSGSSGGAGAAPACFRRLRAAQQGESGEHSRALLCTASQALLPAACSPVSAHQPVGLRSASQLVPTPACRLWVARQAGSIRASHAARESG